MANDNGLHFAPPPCSQDRELLNAVLKVSPVGIGFSKNRTLLWTNPFMAQMLGYRQEELVNKSAAILYPSPEEYHRVGQKLYGMLEQEGFAKLDTQWIRKDGSVFECCLQACPSNPQDFRNVCVVASATDETGRLRVEKALHSEQERFRNLVEEAPFGIAIIDNQGRYQYLNQEFIRIFGYTLEDVAKGRHWFQNAFPDPNYRHEVICTWIDDLKQAKAAQARHRTFTVTCKDGKEKQIHFRPVTMTNGEELIICLDITEQKHLETQLIRAQKMEAMGTLASGVAHDFNNILGAIMGFAELAQLKAPKECKEVRYSLDNILKAGYRAKELIKQILSFSRQKDPAMMPVNISSIVQEVLKLIRATFPATIDIRLQITADNDTVLADPTKIHQMLMNLCTNAHHAMTPSGGTLELSLTNISLVPPSVGGFPEFKAGDYLKLTVSDTGCGIPPEAANQIFDPYFTTKGKDLGTGLGLSVVQNIVQSHGGTIKLKSEPGAGSAFTIFLPVFQGQNQPIGLKTESLPRGNEHILFIDDEEPLADLGMRILQHLGYSVCVHTSSVEALEEFQQRPQDFSLVVTDMAMPHLPGDQLARKLLEIRPDIPIILCTGCSEWVSEKQARRIGIRDFIMKPLVIHQIATTIRKHLDS